MQGGFQIAVTARFRKDYARLAPDIQRQVDDCIRDFALDPLPASRRAHRINTAQFPKVFSVDVTSNKSHKLSFQIDDGVAILRRIGTHKEIDRSF